MPHDFLYENILRPLLFKQDAESVHHFVSGCLQASAPFLSLLPFKYAKNDLAVNLFDHAFANPIGIAAGFDKNGNLISALGHLGFGFAEIGSICASPHGGNDKPRLFRLSSERALRNHLGLNGLGAETVVRQLTNKKASLPYAVNIAKTNNPAIKGDEAVKDYLYSFMRVKELPVIYVAVNVSCPNTKEGCINEAGLIKTVLEEIHGANKRGIPILLKLSPDSNDQFLADLVAAGSKFVQGYICGNTTTSLAGLSGEPVGIGGISGPPLKAANLQLVRKIKNMKNTNQIIIGVGGISSGQDAYDYIRSGASLVELYTGLVYYGPTLVKQICEELSLLLERDGLSLAQAVGSA